MLSYRYGWEDQLTARRRQSSPTTRDLFVRYCEQEDLVARQELIARFLPLAKKLALRYRDSAESVDDLSQVAAVGLIKAVDRFDLDRNVQFTSYAVPTILGELKRHFRDKAWAVKLPRDLQELSLKIDRETDALRTTLRRLPTVNEIGASLGITTEKVLDAVAASAGHRADSLDVQTNAEESMPVIERIGKSDTNFETAERMAAISPQLQKLPIRYREVLYLRFVEDLTQSQIARQVGISQMHVSRLIRISLDRLRSLLSE